MSQTIFHDFQREHGTLVKMNFTESANSITLPNLVVKAAFQVLHRFLHRICQEHHHCMLLEDQRLGDVLCQELVYLVLSWWDAASLIFLSLLVASAAQRGHSRAHRSLIIIRKRAFTPLHCRHISTNRRRGSNERVKS
jgi:hypothetical protein